MNIDLNDKNTKILVKALIKACTMIRHNPPNLDTIKDFMPFEIFIKIIAGGMERDPRGSEFAIWFLEQARKEVEEESDNI